VKQRIERNVRFYGIKDAEDRDGTLTNEEAEAMLGPAAMLWKDQAVGDLEVEGGCR
jgi:hypothetical protein